MILNLGSGRFPLTRAVNLDRSNGWEAPDLPFMDGSIAAVTISHFLMYLPDIDEMFDEIWRVLEPGGVVRITEDDTSDPANVWHDAVYLTTAEDIVERLGDADFQGKEVGSKETNWIDDTLIQSWHGAPPKVFHVEGVKQGWP